nr:FAD-dependent urate hydroxylase-like [Ipomoea batatas]
MEKNCDEQSENNSDQQSERNSDEQSEKNCDKESEKDCAAATEKHEIVIIGGGICGLATALALHRKGLKSIVLERSETLRAVGGGIGLLPNAWRALDQLGVGSRLRSTAVLLQGIGESRCVKRSDLITVLADELPIGTIRLGSEVVSIDLDSVTEMPRLLLTSGSYIDAEIVIGCEGGRSKVAELLGLKASRAFDIGVFRGLTTYPNAHSMPHEFRRITKGKIGVGMLPITQHLINWFVALPTHLLSGDKFPHDPKHIKHMTLELIKDFPSSIQETIELSDLDSLSTAHLRYRAPWDLLLGTMRKGTVTVAGDAMHVMGPFLGQGGAAGLEDAVVLGRCLNMAMSGIEGTSKKEKIAKIEAGLDQYVKERRMRVLGLSTLTYLIGIIVGSTSPIVKMVVGLAIAILFRDRAFHVKYDCGKL